MTAKLIEGRAVAEGLYAKIASAVRWLSQDHGIVPGLAVLLVGNDPASEIYVASKKRMTAQAGMRSFDYRLPGTASQTEVLALLAELNENAAVHGILVQLPLPPQVDPYEVITTINPAKDVDGFHPTNVGRLTLGLATLEPCTPQGCIVLARTVHRTLAGLEAVVIGRSSNLGRPLAQLLIAQDATVTVAHSKTRDLPGVCRRADLLVAAAGETEMVKGSWIKPGATVIDVGINRMTIDDRHLIVGDVAFTEAVKVAGAITPVPGGVGPMTIACLLANTVRAACASLGVKARDL